MSLKPELTVVLVDDEEGIRTLTGPVLSQYGIQTEACDRVLSGRADRLPDVVVLDLDLRESGGTNGMDSVQAARRRWPLVPIVVWSGRAAPQEMARWISEGAIDSFVVKGRTRGEDLAAAIWQAYGRQQGRTPAHAVESLAALLEED